MSLSTLHGRKRDNRWNLLRQTGLVPHWNSSIEEPIFLQKAGAWHDPHPIVLEAVPDCRDRLHVHVPVGRKSVGAV